MVQGREGGKDADRLTNSARERRNGGGGERGQGK